MCDVKKGSFLEAISLYVGKNQLGTKKFMICGGPKLVEKGKFATRQDGQRTISNSIRKVQRGSYDLGIVQFYFSLFGRV